MQVYEIMGPSRPSTSRRSRTYTQHYDVNKQSYLFIIITDAEMLHKR